MPAQSEEACAQRRRRGWPQGCGCQGGYLGRSCRQSYVVQKTPCSGLSQISTASNFLRLSCRGKYPPAGKFGRTGSVNVPQILAAMSVGFCFDFVLGARHYDRTCRNDHSATPSRRPFNLLLGRRVTPDSQASAVGELGCFDIGLIGYIDRELRPALTQQKLRNILAVHRANGLRWDADLLEAAGNWAPRQQRAQRHVRTLATGPASPLCGSADPISAN